MSTLGKSISFSLGFLFPIDNVELTTLCRDERVKFKVKTKPKIITGANSDFRGGMRSIPSVSQVIHQILTIYNFTNLGNPIDWQSMVNIVVTILDKMYITGKKSGQ